MASKQFLVFLFFLVASLLINCSQRKNEDKESQTTKKEPESFYKFYDHFIRDSTFQRSRLKFPLDGRDEHGNQWTPTSWHLMQTKVFDVDTSRFRVYTYKTDTEFFQKVWIPNSGFSTEARFKRIEGKWYLVADFELNN